MGDGDDFSDGRRPVPLREGSRKTSVTRLKAAPASLRWRAVLTIIELAMRQRR